MDIVYLIAIIYIIRAIVGGISLKYSMVGVKTILTKDHDGAEN